MEKKIEKSEFLSKVEAFAHEMTTMTEKKEGVKTWSCYPCRRIGGK